MRTCRRSLSYCGLAPFGFLSAIDCGVNDCTPPREQYHARQAPVDSPIFVLNDRSRGRFGSGATLPYASRFRTVGHGMPLELPGGMSRLRILVVEDDDSLRKVFRVLLFD